MANPSQSSGDLQKAKIVVVDENGNEVSGKSITCMYNPTTLQFSRSASWGEKPVPQESRPRYSYKGGGSATLTVELLFDTTRDINKYGLNVKAGSDVRKYTGFLLSLMEVEQPTKDAPPFCRFEWGGKYFIKGVANNVSVTYKMFLPDGTPIRATANVTFGVVEGAEIDDKPQNPTTQSAAWKTWVVREGERLDWIAYQEYRDPARWRHIAEINNIDDPFDLQSGQILKLVPLP